MKKRVLLLVAMLLLFGSFVVQNFSNKDDTITLRVVSHRNLRY